MNTKDIPTPITDYAELSYVTPAGPQKRGVVLREDMAKLERENVKLKEELKNATPILAGASQTIAKLVAENARLKEEVKKLQAASDHMASCRALLKAPDDDVLFSSIEDLQSRLTETEKMVVGLREAIQLWCNARVSYNEHNECIMDDETRKALVAKFSDALSQVPQILN